MEVDPRSQAASALRMLSGPAAGADRPVRINLLRSLGFPEPAILDDIFRTSGQVRGRRRPADGARSEDEA